MKHWAKEEFSQNKQNISELWDNFKLPNTYVIGVSKGEERGQKNIW